MTFVSQSTPESTARPGFRRRLMRSLKFPRSWAEVKKMGWKFILAFILFYLVRDSILYILIPYLIYRGVSAP